MSDTATTDTQNEPTSATPINRGVGRRLQDVVNDPETKGVWDEFVDLVNRHKTAVAAEEDLKNERNAMIRRLKDDYNVGFTAMSEIVGTSTSFVEYAYERAAGKTAKQIRDEKRASAALKAKLREEDPDYEAKQARKQSPEEREFRKQQREALKAFLASQAEARGEAAPADDESAEVG